MAQLKGASGHSSLFAWFLQLRHVAKLWMEIMGWQVIKGKRRDYQTRYMRKDQACLGLDAPIQD